MAKQRIIFTDNKQSKRGIMSVVLAVISLISLIYGLLQSYRLEGNVSSRYGGALVVTLVMALVGLGLGISGRRSGHSFKFLPTIGIVLNSLAVIILGFLLWVGLN